jgi:uncharacterized membrane protein
MAVNEIAAPGRPTSEGSAKIIYILYLVAIVFGITGLIGVVMAYVYRSDAPDWLRSHYQFQIRTFWIGLLYFLVGLVLTYLLIGYLVLLFWVVWVIVRCVKGIKALDQKEAPPNPMGWMF